jgi:Cu-Zn family superoxide dismutase
MRARADITGERVSGEAEFVEVRRGTQRFVRVTVRLKGDPSALTPGLHGVHVHEKGECQPPFTSAGGHFDPGPASNPDPDVNHPFHMGDIPNIRINRDGSGVLEAVTTRITLSDGPLSIFDGDGSAIIIHGKEDQLISGPSKSGVSGGPRLACGVIKRVS